MLPAKVIHMKEARRRLRRARKVQARSRRNLLERPLSWLRNNVPNSAWIVTGVLAGFIFGAVLAHTSLPAAQVNSSAGAGAETAQVEVLP